MKRKETYINVLMNLMPNFLYLFKRRIILSMLKKHGNNTRGMRYAVIDGYDKIEIGDNFFAASGIGLSATQGIRIGNDVTFGPNVMLIGGNHKIDVPGCKINQIHTGDKLDEIVVENDVWVGANVTVLSGVKIGEGSVVGAGSIVTKPIPPYTVCAGNPCRPIKPRFKTVHELELHLKQVKSDIQFSFVLDAYKKHGLLDEK